ncbi:MAG TPA: type II toxin-antitoxin system HicB family antitoxin [Geminicoccaceae bacterium]|nr:type II toxin-antitoxin system HicB family antitoxin [Geminicoccaceae bacterium]HZA66281.1 type II toxin-antitoxin system HicB family antitoxin [Geminicoccaceae bacterium]
MAKLTQTAADSDKRATYTFNVVVEPDEDAWFAYCPALKGYGAATWGSTRDEALRHIREVVGMVVAELIEDGEELPADVDVNEGTRVSVRA